MTDKSTKFASFSSGSGSGGGGGKPVPMKLFAAWEVDRTPSNCIPRLCSLTITRLSIMTPLPADMTSLSLAVKMQSSKRTLRSHEIPMPQHVIGSGNIGSNNIGSNILITQQFQQQQSMLQQTSGTTLGSSGILGNTIFSTACGGNSGIPSINSTSSLLETDLDLHFSLQYPHFIKRDGNRLVILLQRRKKYKSRTILGYKTLAEGVIRMDAVLQKSMDMTVELIANGKNGRPGTTVATLRAERVASIPVDHDNKNNNSVLLTDRVNEYSDEDEENEFSSGEEQDDGTDLGLTTYDNSAGGNNAKRNTNNHDYTQSQAKRDIRKYRKLQRSTTGGGGSGGDDGVHIGTNQNDSDSEFEIKDKGLSRAKISRTISLQQRNFKQKIVALLKRFKVTEELDGGGSRGAATLRGDRELDALFQELESLSCGEGDDSGPDMDSLSIGSTPKPSLRPFFTNSRTMLHENSNTAQGKNDRRPSDKSDTAIIESKKNSASTPDRNDSSGNEGGTANNTDPEGQNSDPQQQSLNAGSPPREKELITTPSQTTEKQRSRLFRTSSNTPSGSQVTSSGGKTKKQSLSLSAAEPKSVLETCLSPTNVEPRRLLLDQLSKVFPLDETMLPDIVTIISPPEACGSPLLGRLSSILTQTFRPSFVPQNTAEVKAVLQALMTKIQKYCNSNAKPPTTVKVLLLGGDWLQGAALRHYVDLMGVRPPDWVQHLRFYIVPIVSSSISRYLSLIDPAYCQLFGNDNWHQLCERAATANQQDSIINLVNKSDIIEFTQRIQRYLHTVGPCTQIPIAEAMVNYKDEDSCQIFVPFVSDVRIGVLDGPNLSLDLDENSSQQSSSTMLQQQQSSIGIVNQPSSTSLVGSHSPPISGRNSPPTAPMTPVQQQTHQQTFMQQLTAGVTGNISSSNNQMQQQQDSVDLQIDYWPVIRHIDQKDKQTTKGGDQGGKNSIKSQFRNLHVLRLPANPHLGEISHGLTVIFATKEKKQKIMRLGKKKEKDRDQEKEQCVEGVARLICSAKQSHPIPLKVYIDGTEWTGVKFFQLSSQWQTHVKNFPVALIGSCSDMT